MNAADMIEAFKKISLEVKDDEEPMTEAQKAEVERMIAEGYEIMAEEILVKIRADQDG